MRWKLFRRKEQPTPHPFCPCCNGTGLNVGRPVGSDIGNLAIPVSQFDVAELSHQLNVQADRFGGYAKRSSGSGEMVIINTTVSMMLYALANALNDTIKVKKNE